MENQNSNKTFRLLGSICSVLALVLGILCLLLSFIPLVGALALYPSIFAFLCAVVGLVFAVKAGSSTGASVTALVITILALLFSYSSYVAVNAIVNPNAYRNTPEKDEITERTENKTTFVQTQKQEIEEEMPKNRKEEESSHKKIEDLGDGWNRFYHKYGFYLELPNNFKATLNSLESSYYLKEWKVTSAGTQYYHTHNIGESEKSTNDVIINVTAVTSNRNKKYLEDRYQTYLKDKNVHYKAIHDDWYVASGYQGKDAIFYEKAFFKNNYIYFLNISYKNHEKSYIEPLLDRIQKSFR